MVPLAAVGNRGKIGAVCFNHNAIHGHSGNGLQCTAGILKGHNAGKAHIPAQPHQLLVPRGLDQLRRIGIDFVGHMDLLRRLDQGLELFNIRHRLDAVQRVGVVAVLHDGDLALDVRIAHVQPNQEAVQLGVGQRLGPGGAHRVLRRQDDKRHRQRPGQAIDRHLPFFHRLQQRRLRLAGGPVDLICQQQIRHNCAGFILQARRLAIVDGEADDIRRQCIRCELHTLCVQPQHLGKGQGHCRLADAGNILEQDVPLCQNDRKYPDQHAVLAADCLLDLR